MADSKDKLVYDLELKNSEPEAKQPKVIFAGDQYDGQAVLAIEEGDISMFASKSRGISVSEKFGVLIAGPIHFAAMPHELSFGGGYWRLDPRHLSVLASTTPTPIPLLVKAIPDLLRAKKDLGKIVDDLQNNPTGSSEEAVYGSDAHETDWTSV